MDFERNLKETLINHYESIDIPTDLKQKLFNTGVEYKHKVNFRFMKRVMVVCFMVFLMLPSLGFGVSYLANQIYGSAESAKQYGITEPEFLKFNNKLNEASQTLSPKEFVEFIGLAKNLVFFMLRNGDMTTSDRSKLGQVDITKLSPDKQKEYNEILSNIQPYFDKLNAPKGIK